MNKKTIITLVIFLALVGVWLAYRAMGPGEASLTPKDILPSLSKDRVTKVEISRLPEKDNVVLEMTKRAEPPPQPTGDAPQPAAKAEDVWEMVSPLKYPADKNAVNGLLSKLEEIRLTDMVSKDKAKHARFEVSDTTGALVKVYEKDAMVASFHLGKVSGGFTFVRLPGQDEVYQTPGSLKYAFSRPPKDWRDKKIFNFKRDDAVRIEIQHPDEKAVVSKVEGKWKIIEPQEAEADDKTVTAIVSALYSLRTFDFADDAKAEETGLATPACVVTVHTQDSQAYTLKVGKAAKEKEYYAQREGDPQVFILKSYTTERIDKRAADLLPKAEEAKGAAPAAPAQGPAPIKGTPAPVSAPAKH